MAAQTKSTHVPWWAAYFNLIARPLLAAGVPMGPDVLLTVRGRKTEDVTAVELAAPEAAAFIRDVLAPVARQTRLGAWIVRTIDKIDIDHPVEAAQGRPVFELHPLEAH